MISTIVPFGVTEGPVMLDGRGGIQAILALIVILLMALSIGRHYLASIGLPARWLSVTWMIRTCGRVATIVARTLWQVLRSITRYVQRKRRFRRRSPGRSGSWVR